MVSVTRISLGTPSWTGTRNAGLALEKCKSPALNGSANDFQSVGLVGKTRVLPDFSKSKVVKAIV